MDVVFRTALPADIAEAARTLAAAFDDYAWTRWAIPAEDHHARLERLQSLYLEHALAHGIVLVDDDVDAVVAVTPPDMPAPDEQTSAEIARLHGDRLAALAEVRLPARREGSWDFATLGVRPSRQGVGLGSAAVTAALERVAEIDREAVVTLETSDERNVALYERHGFVVFARTVIDTGPVVFSMEGKARRG